MVFKFSVALLFSGKLLRSVNGYPNAMNFPFDRVFGVHKMVMSKPKVRMVSFWSSVTNEEQSYLGRILASLQLLHSLCFFTTPLNRHSTVSVYYSLQSHNSCLFSLSEIFFSLTHQFTTFNRLFLLNFAILFASLQTTTVALPFKTVIFRPTTSIALFFPSIWSVVINLSVWENNSHLIWRRKTWLRFSTAN